MGDARVVILVQRVRVRWSAASRGAVDANVRSQLPESFPLPEVSPDHDVVVHDVMMDEAHGYRPGVVVSCGQQAVNRACLNVIRSGESVSVEIARGWWAYPYRERDKVFVLGPGQVGRYRANGRVGFCQCDEQWFYEQWNVLVANRTRGDSDLFMGAHFHEDMDDRVHIYGGRSTRGHI